MPNIIGKLIEHMWNNDATKRNQVRIELSLEELTKQLDWKDFNELKKFMNNSVYKIPEPEKIIKNSLCDVCLDNDICKDVSIRKTCGAYKAQESKIIGSFGKAADTFVKPQEPNGHDNAGNPIQYGINGGSAKPQEKIKPEKEYCQCKEPNPIDKFGIGKCGICNKTIP